MNEALTMKMPAQDSDGPSTLKLSLPMILRQNVPGYKGRQSTQAHARRSGSGGSRASTSIATEPRFGRRKQRRHDNDHFVGAKHIAVPRSSDFQPSELCTHYTFPAPPPSAYYNPRHPGAPSAENTSTDSRIVFDDSRAAEFGRFSLPMKGLKRSMRRIVSNGGPGETIVETIDAHIRQWLDSTQVFLHPDMLAVFSSEQGKTILCLDPLDSGNEGSDDGGCSPTIIQISQLPHAIIWQAEDPFVRFLIHAVARYYNIVSFTKNDVSSSRHLVHLLRPQVAKASTLAPSSLVTPPTTEWEQSSIASLTPTDMSSAPQSDDGYSLVDSISELAMTSDEAEMDDNTGDLTVLPQLSSPATQPASPYIDTRIARPPRLGPQHRPALSDIDSGNEVDVEPDSDDDMVSLAGTLEQTEQTRSLSLSAAVLPKASTPIQPPIARNVLTRPQSKAGWALPEYTFMQWMTLPC